MSRETFGAALRRLRGTRTVRAVAERSAISKTQISDLESGKRRPTAAVAEALDNALDAGGELIALAAVSPSLPAGEQAGRLQHAVADALTAAGPMTDAGAEDWEYTVTRHARATRWRPEADLLPDLTADLADLQRILGHRHTAQVRRRLTTCLAQLAGLVALTLLKAADPGARDWWRTGRAAATAADDRATLSWIYAQEAYQLFYNGDVVGALEISNRAQYIAGGLPCAGPALAAPLEARAHAVLGRPDRAAAALTAGQTALARLSPDLQVSSALGYSPANLHFHAGDTWTRLGDTDRARDQLHHALALYPATDYTDRALIGLDLAACHTADGNPDAAAALAADTVAGLPPEHRSALITNRARQVAATVPEGTARQALHRLLAHPPAE
ncbi:helix-turn-helix domain-containing protein [Actinacidiphila sp. ITFR-21]|uniref:helix-turn-helix domain-containing protein n=1 Tax=Actinacidiphila sp. ITFR-21 TaxID=3075199 RepID=UPI00288A46E7|nr:helix-turn-helix transcriptional regulator [Streptomyces sp. ITFR-21]WNI19959.1 helix-turn-helix transcriptional regulator [Streptomyces sp. ITFR-21]